MFLLAVYKAIAYIITFSVLLTMALSLNQHLSPVNALNFIHIVGKLKTLKRTGWVHNGIYLY